MMKKTRREWFNALPEPIRSKALANTKSQGFLDIEEPDLWNAIAGAFAWDKSPEDYDYWHSVANGINPETGEKLILEN